MNLQKAVAKRSTTRAAAYRILRVGAIVAPAGPPPRVLVNSLPKAGTHLAATVVEHLPRMRYAAIDVRSALESASARRAERCDPRPLSEFSVDAQRRVLSRPKDGQYLHAHFSPSAELFGLLDTLGYRTIYVIRDPRDMVVSGTMYALGLERHPLHQLMSACRSDSERMAISISGREAGEGTPRVRSIEERLQTHRSWLDAPNTLVCRFEDLVGPAGGGSRDKQAQSIERIAGHLNRPLGEDGAAASARGLEGSRTATFRSGQVGQWRTAFSPDVRELFKEKVPDRLMEAYGYRHE